MQNQPPVQMSSQPPAQVGKSSTGLDENIAALLSYILGGIGGLVFFLIEKDSRLVRFHAMQSLLLNVLVAIIVIALLIVSSVVLLITSQISGVMSMLFSLLGTLIWIVLFIGIVIAVVMCLIKAYGRQYFKLPIIGNFAEKFSQK